MAIDRYYPDADSFGNYHGMERAKFGEYVLYNEHAERVLVLSRQEHETANRLDNANARIAELTTEVADLKSKLDFANAMNADQDKEVADLTADLKVADRASLELAAEVALLREDLKKVADFKLDTEMDKAQCVWHLRYIARNALKDGV